MKHWILGTLLALLAPLSFAGEANNVTVRMVGYNADVNHLFYALVTPAGTTATECGYTVLRIPSTDPELSKALLSMLMSAQATGNKVNITYSVPSSQVCNITAVQVLSGS